MDRSDSPDVLIAGGGVAALEAALALRALGEGAIRVELLAPEPQLWYRPLAVAEPFALGEVRHFDLSPVWSRRQERRSPRDSSSRSTRRATSPTPRPEAPLRIRCFSSPVAPLRGPLSTVP